MYSVRAQEGSHTNMIGAHGDCLIAITTESEILCALASTKQVVGVWPFNCLRRYWCGEGVFGFEAGKRSPRGEGTFSFVSVQDEEIYTTLKKYIDRAKQATLQGKRTGVDSRPKFPLPPESSPPVSEDEMVDEIVGDLNYAEIPATKESLVGPPRSVSPYQRRSSLHHTDVSGPSPVYMMKRNQTCRPRRIQQWVETTEAATSQRWEGDTGGGTGGVVGGNIPPSMFPRGGRDPLTLAEEDMYSHTQHVVPAPFQRRATDHNIVEESTYHTLVHDKCATLKNKREPQGGVEGGGGGGGEEGEGAQLYSIAYPPDVARLEGRQIRVVSGPDNEYGTLDREAIDSGAMQSRTLSNLPLAPAKTADSREQMIPSVRTVPNPVKYPTRNSGPPTPGNVLQDSSDFESSMTDNLLYNTQVDVILAMHGLGNSSGRNVQVSPEVSGGRSDGQRERDREERRGGEVEGGSGETGGRGETGDVGGETGEGGEETGGGRGSGGETGGETGIGETGDGEGGEARGGAGEMVGGGSVGTEETGAVETGSDGIQRDAKGYSKVDKSKKQKSADSASRQDSEDPPPVPPRLYEGSEDVIGHTGEPPLTPVDDDDKVAVSDV